MVQGGLRKSSPEGELKAPLNEKGAKSWPSVERFSANAHKVRSCGSNEQRKRDVKDFAAHLGFSVTTVSRALKRGPEVHKDTIEQVEAAALALGYRPHLAGINLRTGRTHAVGLFLPLERPGEINNLASSLVEGVSASLTAVDYRVTVVPVTQSEQSLDAVKELVRARSVDGVILKNTKPKDERVKFLLESGLPFVAFGRTELLSDHAFFDIDHEAVGAGAAKLLFDAGHSAPLIIAPPRDLTYSRLFLKGWREGHARFDRPFDEVQSHLQRGNAE